MNSRFFDLALASPLQTHQFVNRETQTLKFQVKRDDLLDAAISGNKWRKLKYNAKFALDNGFKGIASFGGAFSNHIAALSALGKRVDLPTLGIIRGMHSDTSNPTLSLATQNGMKLLKVSTEQYRLRHDPCWLAELESQFPGYFWVPEGGSNELALPGLSELGLELITQQANPTLVCPVGSGGTLEGLMTALPEQRFIAVAVVNDKALLDRLEQLGGARLTFIQDADLMRYGKPSNDVIDFCLDFYQQTGLVIEPIYSGKLFYALCERYPDIVLNQACTFIHTGGLQGLKGLVARHPKLQLLLSAAEIWPAI